MAGMRPFGFSGGADPFRELRRLQNEMSQLMGALEPARGPTAAGGFPAVNINAGHEEQRVLSIRGRADTSLPKSLAPLYVEYEPGDYERSFTLTDAVDPAGIEARVRSGVLHLRLPKAGPAKRQQIEVKAD
jgi:Hsp20/alpha crystallin family